MAKLKLKKKVRNIFILSIFVVILLTIGLFTGIKINKQKKYEQTYEYKLITRGYNEDDVKTIIKNYKNKEINYILDNKENNIYLDLLKDKYFIYDNFYDYLNYYNGNKDKNIRNIIEVVNTNTNKEYYTNPVKTDISKKELMLVNKYNHLDNTYTPETLVTVPTTYAWGEYGSKKVTQDTYDAFLNLWNAGKEQNYYFMVSSAYRTYEHQEEVYNDYKKSRGEEYADKIAARPGFSEHQTGYSLDIFEKSTTQKNFHTTESYNWLKNNAHKYGFILRYPEDKEDITGYSFESWHYRYVGKEVATYIYENGITFDEYYAYFVK